MKWPCLREAPYTLSLYESLLWNINWNTTLIFLPFLILPLSYLNNKSSLLQQLTPHPHGIVVLCYTSTSFCFLVHLYPTHSHTFTLSCSFIDLHFQSYWSPASFTFRRDLLLCIPSCCSNRQYHCITTFLRCSNC